MLTHGSRAGGDKPSTWLDAGILLHVILMNPKNTDGLPFEIP
jgi:hypothetical protein